MTAPLVHPAGRQPLPPLPNEIVAISVLIAAGLALVALQRTIRKGGLTGFRKSALFFAIWNLAFTGYWAAYAWGNRYR